MISYLLMILQEIYAVPVKMANAIALAIKQQVFKGDANNEYR